jgi:ATP-dependent helicase/nuclease subunit A
MFNDPKGRWILGLDDPHPEAAAEFALSGELDGSVVNCIIDRTFLDSQGTRWIVDFKTSRHEGGGLQEFLAREVERYRPQLQKYSHLMQALRPEQPIKTALYFPLMRQWREVT